MVMNLVGPPTDLNGTPVKIGDRVAVARQVGYSVGLYLADVLDVYQDKYNHDKVKVKYIGNEWRTPERAQSVGLDKVVVLLDRPTATA